MHISPISLMQNVVISPNLLRRDLSFITQLAIKYGCWADSLFSFGSKYTLFDRETVSLLKKNEIKEVNLTYPHLRTILKISTLVLIAYFNIYFATAFAASLVLAKCIYKFYYVDMCYFNLQNASKSPEKLDFTLMGRYIPDRTTHSLMLKESKELGDFKKAAPDTINLIFDQLDLKDLALFSRASVACFKISAPFFKRKKRNYTSIRFQILKTCSKKNYPPVLFWLKILNFLTEQSS